MPSRQQRFDIMAEIGGYELDDGYDYHQFMQDAYDGTIDWSQHRWTDEELYLAALKQPPLAVETPWRNPPKRYDHVPLDIDAVIDLGGGSWRLRYTMVADDGYPTEVDEVVIVTGDVDTELPAYFDDKRRERATQNRAAATKRAERTRDTPPLPDGAVDESRTAAFDALFPTNRQ